IKQTQLTNRKYRAIGLGTFGWHHLLALKDMHWETAAAAQYADELYEKIAYWTTETRVALSKEKGWCPACSGRCWRPGECFEIRGYSYEKWIELMEAVQKDGIRKGY